MVKWGKAYDTVSVFIGPNHRQSLLSSGVMEKIKLPHSHVSDSRPLSFANRKCLFKYSSFQHVLEPSGKSKDVHSCSHCHHLAVGERWASACLRAGPGEGAPHEGSFSCRLRLWLEKNYICGFLLYSEGQRQHLFTLHSLVNVLSQAPPLTSSPPRASVFAAWIINDTEFSPPFI